MKKNVGFLLILIVIPVFESFAQEQDKKFGIEFSGFVKNDMFYDSRQNVTAREGHFLLWPAPELLDPAENDINDKSNLNFLAVQSRLSGKITGPDALGAKTSGVIEGDFFAQANDNINLFRLRHAYLHLKWTNTELLSGQYWNPLFVTGCFPGTISFNTGTPLQSFSRNPQLRLIQYFGNLKVIAAAVTQRDFTSRGPDPADTTNRSISINSDFLRNSAFPDMHLQVHYNIKNEASGTDFLAGVGLAIKSIVPRLSSFENGVRYKVEEKLNSHSVIAFSKIKLAPVTLKLQGRYGENIADVLSISGFAVKAIEDPLTGESSYTPLQNITVWGEIHTNGPAWQVGVFGGYLKNLGTKDEMSSALNPVYGLGTNIESLLRISPRVSFTSGKVKLAGEIEYTSAAFGSNHDVNYIPENTSAVANTRVLISTIYSF